jgi:hypothetical protein
MSESEAIVPLEAILFQVLFLLVAIAIEARVLQKGLKLSRKTSVEYAISLNLFCATLGWFVFFLLQNRLPQLLKVQVISFIFFDRLLGTQPERLNLLIASVGIVLFFSAFLIKLIGLELLKSWLRLPRGKGEDPWRRPTEGTENNPLASELNQATVMLRANAYSHGAILFLLLLRYFRLYDLNII